MSKKPATKHTEQGSDTPSSIRIRENQRRSRNQRKELIQDLQRRVQEYELKGIAATQEMQRAARKVADENARLRSLLASRGVTRDEVDAYLRSFDCAAALVPAAAAATTTTTTTTTTTALPRHIRPVQQQQQQMPQRAQIERMPPAVQPRASVCQPSVQPVAESPPANQALPGVMPHQAHHAKQHANIATSSAPYEPVMPTTAPQQPSCCRPAESSMHETSAATYPTLEGDPDCPNTANCFCAPTPVPKERPADTGLLISCETAATIIAEMRGDADRNRIKDSLGCGGRKDCVVKNTLVLELMDER